MYYLFRFLDFPSLFLLPNNIDLPFLRFQVNLRHIQSHDPHGQQDQSAQEGNDGYHGRPPGYRISVNQCTNHNKGQSQERNATNNESHNGRQIQGNRGIGQNSLYRILKQLPERPFGLPGTPLHIFIGNPLGMETHPAENSFGKSVVFRISDHRIYHLPAHHPVVPGSIHDFRIGQLIDDLIEQPGKERPHRRFCFSSSIFPHFRHSTSPLSS